MYEKNPTIALFVISKHLADKIGIMTNEKIINDFLIILIFYNFFCFKAYLFISIVFYFFFSSLKVIVIVTVFIVVLFFPFFKEINENNENLKK